MTNIRFHASFELWNDTIALYAKSGAAMVRPMEFVDHEEGLITEPFARLNMESAQELANALWEAGIRPTQGKNSEGVTDAQGRHLEDMRAIAFAKLNIGQPSGERK